MKRTASPIPSATPHPPGCISVHEAYTLEEIKARLGIGVAELRTARRRGLVLRTWGRKKFLLGRDVIDYLERQQN